MPKLFLDYYRKITKLRWTLKGSVCAEEDRSQTESLYQTFSALEIVMKLEKRFKYDNHADTVIMPSGLTSDELYWITGPPSLVNGSHCQT